MIYNILVKIKSHERIDLLITATEYLSDKKKYSNSNENFSGKKIKQLGNPPF